MTIPEPEELTGICAHADRELRHVGLSPEAEDGPNKWAYDNVMALMRVFAGQGHSGFSASYVRGLFHKLANYEPLGPLTGEPDEWNEVSPGLYQNKRCSRVFKEGDKVWDIDGKVFRDRGGVTFTNINSRVEIMFPYTPKTEVVDVGPEGS